MSNYPDGTDLSYFDWDDDEQDHACPNCGEVSTQRVVVRGNRRNRHCLLQGECPECGHEWEDDWYDD